LTNIKIRYNIAYKYLYFLKEIKYKKIMVMP